MKKRVKKSEKLQHSHRNLTIGILVEIEREREMGKKLLLVTEKFSTE